MATGSMALFKYGHVTMLGQWCHPFPSDTCGYGAGNSMAEVTGMMGCCHVKVSRTYLSTFFVSIILDSIIVLIWPHGHIWPMTLSKYGHVTMLGQWCHQYLLPFGTCGCGAGNSMVEVIGMVACCHHVKVSCRYLSSPLVSIHLFLGVE